MPRLALGLMEGFSAVFAYPIPHVKYYFLA